MTNKTSDEQLVKATQNGDKQAEDELFVRYGGMVRRRARGFFLVGGETEDLIQEGMVGLHRAIVSYDPEKENGRSFKNYAYLCVSRKIIDAVKRASGNTVVKLLSLDGGFELAEKFDPDDGMIREEDAAELFKAVSKNLSDFEFRVVRLYMDGFSYSEICDATGKPAKSVGNALHRSKKKLQRMFEKTGDL